MMQQLAYLPAILRWQVVEKSNHAALAMGRVVFIARRSNGGALILALKSEFDRKARSFRLLVRCYLGSSRSDRRSQ
jgi:hypothetical protein